MTARTRLRTVLALVLLELGLPALHAAPRDTKLLILQRALRLVAYGASTLILVSHLTALGMSRSSTGLFLTLTLAGDTVLSLALALFADQLLGRRFVLRAGCVLVSLSGCAFAISTNYWVLLAAAVLGVISPSGNEIGPFRAVEQSIVAQLTQPQDRGDVYAWYNLLGVAGAAVGMAAAGWLVRLLRDLHGWREVEAYQLVFAVYGGVGVLMLALVLMLSPAVEAPAEGAEGAEAAAGTSVGAGRDVDESAGEREPLLPGGGGDRVGEDNNGVGGGKVGPRRMGLRAIFPEISKESVGVVIDLCVLFALDSFASGLASLSWVAYFFKSEYNLEDSVLGSIFFATSLISALSMIVASSLARRFGNVNTMVFTHLPSSLFLSLIPVHPLPVSLVFLVLRSCTSNMDVAPRSAFLAAVVLPRERTAVMGLTNTVRTTAQSLGPLTTGLLADRGRFWVSFVLAGSLKACYDLGLLVVFKNHDAEGGRRRRLSGAVQGGGEPGGGEGRRGYAAGEDSGATSDSSVGGSEASFSSGDSSSDESLITGSYVTQARP